MALRPGGAPGYAGSAPAPGIPYAGPRPAYNVSISSYDLLLWSQLMNIGLVHKTRNMLTKLK